MTYKRAKVESSRTKTNYKPVFVGRAILVLIKRNRSRLRHTIKHSLLSPSVAHTQRLEQSVRRIPMKYGYCDCKTTKPCPLM